MYGFRNEHSICNVSTQMQVEGMEEAERSSAARADEFSTSLFAP